MKQPLFTFFVIIPTMLLIDSIWLSVMLTHLYMPNIGHLLSESVSILPAILFYLLFAFALNVFVISPGLKENSPYRKIGYLGALFGMVTYGTYDLTNHATMINWPWIVTLSDIAWGSILTATVSIITTFIVRKFR